MAFALVVFLCHSTHSCKTTTNIIAVKPRDATTESCGIARGGVGIETGDVWKLRNVDNQFIGSRMGDIGVLL